MAKNSAATFKKCTACGRNYTKQEWDQLESLGVMDVGGGIALDHRNCPCNGTMTVEVEA